MSENIFKTKEEFEKTIIEKCWKDEEFKQKLLNNANETIKDEFDINLGNIKINVVESNPNEIVIGIPPNPTQNDEIKEKELDSISGGTFNNEWPPRTHDFASTQCGFVCNNTQGICINFNF